MKSVVFFLLAFLISCSVKQSTTEFFVSPSGNDNNPGTIELPFATAERARNEVRKLKQEDNSSITVLFREGIYRFSKPLLLTYDDSGEKGKEIKYSAYENE
ncbi:MAG: carbohydrate-binding protein, partial [Bacteroidota bacterium]